MSSIVQTGLCLCAEREWTPSRMGLRGQPVFEEPSSSAFRLLLWACPLEKPQGRLILGRPFSVVAGPRLRVSPRVLRDMVSRNLARRFPEEHQSLLPLVPVMVPMRVVFLLF